MEPHPATVARRLAAILAADAANFSRLVAQDEEATLQVLAGHRTVIDRTIIDHGGRIVTTAGDSVLAEFSSPVQAVRAALAIQHALLARNADAAISAPMLFRIGINVGDVVVDGDNILGDDVNVAVRLENLAPPGGICIAASVREHVLGKLDVRLQDLGTQFLKNIPRPVRAYQVIADMRGPESIGLRASRVGFRLMLGAAAALAVLAIGAWLSLDDPGAAPGARAGAGKPAGSFEEYALWDSVKQSSDPAELRAYLDKYPRGIFSELAHARVDGLLAAKQRRGEDEEATAKAAEALRAQVEAVRLRSEAEAAISRAALEQETAARLKGEARAAAQRADAAARSAAEAQQRLGRVKSTGLTEQVTLLRIASPLDGRWTADWTCEASAEQPAETIRLPAQIQYRQIRIEAGQVGLPGYFRAYGTVSDEGAFELQGSHLPRSQRIVRSEDPLQASGKLDGERLEGNGSIGKRRCSLALSRAAAP